MVSCEFPSLVCFAQGIWMLCSRCNIFLGAPCDVCRSLSRLSFLLGTGRIQREDEAIVLGALRQACGVLSDLVERGPRDKYGVDRTTSTGNGAEPEVVKAEEKEAEEKHSEAKESRPKKDKKEKEKKHKKDKKERKESAGEEGAAKEKREEQEIESLVDSKRLELAKVDPSNSGVKGFLTDAEVKEDPESFGLFHGPQDERSDRSSSKRPVFSGEGVPEPNHPPRHHDEEIRRRRPEAVPKKRD